MLKYTAVTALLLFLLSGPLVAQGQPQYIADKWELSLFFGLSAIEDTDSATPVGQESFRLVTLDYTSGYVAGVRITENLGSRFGAELEYGFANQPMALANLRSSLPRLAVKHHVHSFFYSFQYYPIERKSRLRPYLSVGLGVGFYQIDGSSKAQARVAGVPLKDRWKLAGGFGGGVKYLLGSRWGIRFDVRDQITGVPDYGLPDTAPSFQDESGIGFNPDGLQHNLQFSCGLLFTWGGF